MTQIETELKLALNESKSYKNYLIETYSDQKAEIGLSLDPATLSMSKPLGAEGDIVIENYPNSASEYFNKHTMTFSAKIVYTGDDIKVSPIYIYRWPISPYVASPTEVKCQDGQVFKGFEADGTPKCYGFENFKDCDEGQFLYFIKNDYSGGKCASLDQDINCNEAWIDKLNFNYSVPSIADADTKAPVADKIWSFSCTPVQIDPWAAEPLE
jgi:hypothetical protein